MSEAAKKALEALESASKHMTEAELEYYTGRSEGFEAGFKTAVNADSSNEESGAEEDAKT